MSYTTYDANGQIIATFNGAGAKHNINGLNYIEESHSDLTHYIDVNTKLPIEKPTKPLSECHHIWNPITKQWQIHNTRTATLMRNKRDKLLLLIDKVGPVWYACITQVEQIQLGIFRAELLNVPQQGGFPTNIVWPIVPPFLISNK
jgi:hypothetical protein